ncbi:MAG: hypothetical protein ACI4HQ_10470 [Acetatifactor sp.]
MRFCIIVNALGFAAGIFQWTGIMYVCFGISFTAFFRVYAQAVWDLIYERESHLVDLGGQMNMSITNELSCIMVLAAVYIVVARNAGLLCVVLSALQNMLFQFLKLKKNGEHEKIPAILAAGELLISFVFLF